MGLSANIRNWRQGLGTQQFSGQLQGSVLRLRWMPGRRFRQRD
jgi:hypothetical protein